MVWKEFHFSPFLKARVWLNRIVLKGDSHFTQNENGFFSIMEKKLQIIIRLDLDPIALLRAKSFSFLPQTALNWSHRPGETFWGSECPGLWAVYPCWEAELWGSLWGKWLGQSWCDQEPRWNRIRTNSSGVEEERCEKETRAEGRG